MVRRGIRLGVATTLTAAFLAIAPAAEAGADAGASRSCGTVVSVIKKTYALNASGVGCKSARNLIKGYYAKAKRGDCGGNRCFAKVGAYSCSTKTAADERRTGISTTCTRGKKRVRTLVVPRDHD